MVESLGGAVECDNVVKRKYVMSGWIVWAGLMFTGPRDLSAGVGWLLCGAVESGVGSAVGLEVTTRQS